MSYSCWSRNMLQHIPHKRVMLGGFPPLRVMPWTPINDWGAVAPTFLVCEPPLVTCVKIMCFLIAILLDKSSWALKAPYRPRACIHPVSPIHTLVAEASLHSQPARLVALTIHTRQSEDWLAWRLQGLRSNHSSSNKRAAAPPRAAVVTKWFLTK